MSRPWLKNSTEHDGRLLKIALGDLRSTGVRDLLVFCQDYRRSHVSSLRLTTSTDGRMRSGYEPRFVCTACGMRDLAPAHFSFGEAGAFFSELKRHWSVRLGLPA